VQDLQARAYLVAAQFDAVGDLRQPRTALEPIRPNIVDQPAAFKHRARTVNIAPIESVLTGGDMERHHTIAYEGKRLIFGKPHVHANDVVRRAVDFEANFGGKHDRVQDVVIIPVDLYGDGLGQVRGRERVVEISLPKPTSVHHDFVATVDLDTCHAARSVVAWVMGQTSLADGARRCCAPYFEKLRK
jgi:hypothetical protein